MSDSGVSRPAASQIVVSAPAAQPAAAAASTDSSVEPLTVFLIGASELDRSAIAHTLNPHGVEVRALESDAELGPVHLHHTALFAAWKGDPEAFAGAFRARRRGFLVTVVGAVPSHLRAELMRENIQLMTTDDMGRSALDQFLTQGPQGFQSIGALPVLEPDAELKGLSAPLSARERQIAGIIVDDPSITRTALAQRLGISEGTLKVHLRRLRTKARATGLSQHAFADRLVSIGISRSAGDAESSPGVGGAGRSIAGAGAAGIAGAAEALADLAADLSASLGSANPAVAGTA